MAYSLLYGEDVVAWMRQIPADVRRRVAVAINTTLSTRPRPDHHVRLRVGFRITIEDHRVLYTIDDDGKTVQIYRIRPVPEGYDS